jgi:predicted MPP superfamily phosphohydrolase
MTQSPSNDSARRIAVISDVHANSQALRAALEQARKTGFDDLVVLGDLLTYGCSPREVLDLIGEAMVRYGAHLTTGNHDQLYFDLAVGHNRYYDELPAWLRETVDWTREALGRFDLKSQFNLKDE